MPAIEHFQPYDGLQLLMYSRVLFVLAPLIIVTGLAMAPAVVDRFPWFPKLFGGRQAARSLPLHRHGPFMVFIVTHVGLVLLVHPEHNLVHMILGGVRRRTRRPGVDPRDPRVVVVLAFWIAASYVSLLDVRTTQRILYGLQTRSKRFGLNG